MCVNVLLKLEHLGTDLALEGHVSLVCLLMSFQNDFGLKFSQADMALKRFLVTVSVHVRLQRTLDYEPVGAYLALKWLLTLVHHDVLAEVMLRG